MLPNRIPLMSYFSRLDLSLIPPDERMRTETYLALIDQGKADWSTQCPDHKAKLQNACGYVRIYGNNPIIAAQTYKRRLETLSESVHKTTHEVMENIPVDNALSWLKLGKELFDYPEVQLAFDLAVERGKKIMFKEINDDVFNYLERIDAKPNHIPLS